MNINPIAEDENGGKIEPLKDGEIANHLIEISPAAQAILEKIPQEKRVQYLFDSEEPELENEIRQLFEKIGIKRTPYKSYDYQ